MVGGHFGFAAGVKCQVPSAPLWALMLASPWLDVFFVPLYLVGIETIEPADITRPVLGFGLWQIPVAAAAIKPWTGAGGCLPLLPKREPTPARPTGQPW